MNSADREFARDERLLALLGEIAVSLAQIARNTERARPEEPNYQRPLEHYARFDWTSIDATVVATDGYGPTVVEWGGFTWKRRAPENKFGAAIWYSRTSGKDDDGANKYLRLITFKPLGEVEPISRAAEKAVKESVPPPAPVTPSTASSPTAAELDREFDNSPSAQEERQAAAETWLTDPSQACPTCGQVFLMENEDCPHHRAPRLPGEVLRRQASLAGGKVGGEFKHWAAGFAARNPRYLLKSGEPDLFVLLKTLASFGIETVAAGNLAYAQARLEAHAAQQPGLVTGK